MATRFTWLQEGEAVVEFTLDNGTVIISCCNLNESQKLRARRQMEIITGPAFGPAIEDLPPYALAGVEAAIVGYQIEYIVEGAQVSVLHGDKFPIRILLMYRSHPIIITLTRRTPEERVFRRLLSEIGKIRARDRLQARVAMLQAQEARRLAREALPPAGKLEEAYESE